jgi:hypothetical protein
MRNHWWIPFVLAALLIGAGAGLATAQTVEAGGTLAASCAGSDGSFCSDGNLVTAGPYASVWFLDALEVGGRVAWLGRDDIRFEDPLAGVSGSIGDRGRFMAQADAIWHFRRDRRIRPFVGFGVGAFRDRATVSCAPPGCETHLPRSGLTAGTQHEWHGDEAVIIGVSALATPRVRLRGGLRYHNPFRDELALAEWFIGVGYVLGR